MAAARLYGIANCDTIRKARRWLERAGVEYAFHDYRKHGPDAALLAQFDAALGWENLLNRRGTTWRRLPAAARDNLDAGAALVLMREYPALIRRPILVHGERHLAGFDESEYEEVFRRHA